MQKDSFQHIKSISSNLKLEDRNVYAATRASNMQFQLPLYAAIASIPIGLRFFSIVDLEHHQLQNPSISYSIEYFSQAHDYFPLAFISR